MNIRHSSFKRFAEEIWSFIRRIGKRFRKDLNYATSCGNTNLDSDSSSERKENISEIFDSLLVQSIRETSANIEKISDFEWEDMENQDSEDVS
jgi:hypothetical protein